MARERREDADVFVPFIQEYYAEMPEFGIDERRIDDMYAVAAAHYRLGEERQAGETLVRVVNPDRDRDGWSSPHSVLMLVTDDSPFLVDTVRMVLLRANRATHLLVHPLIDVDRNADCMICGIGGDIPEAWTQIEIDACTDEQAEMIGAAVKAAVEDVRSSVRDFPAISERMQSLAHIDPLLEWFVDGHLVFLGAAVFDRDESGKAVVRPGSVLGHGANGGEPDPPLVWPAGGDDKVAVVVGRSEGESSIHRPARQTAVTVFPGDGTAHRFAGLLASSAYRQSVLSIPTIGARAKAVLGLAESGAESHTGRSMRNVLETLPRELLFEVDADTLAKLVISVVGLQERQVVRAIEVREPIGHSSWVLVYMPRTRYTAKTGELVASIIAEQYGSETRDLDAHVSSGSLARIALTVGHTPGVDPDLDDVSEIIDEATTSWAERVRELLVDEVGVAEAQRVMSGVGAAAPARFQASVPARVATGDLRRIDELMRSEDDLTTAMTRDVDARPGEWRFRVYRREAPLALADLLPLFGHLGLRALDEHPYDFRVDGTWVHVYDIGVLVPPSIEIDARRHAEIRATFEALAQGEIEADGLNRLVTVAGLSRRQVEVLRAYSRYLQQIGFVFSQAYIEDTLVRLPDAATHLVELFEARFKIDDTDRDELVTSARERTLEVLDAIATLDDDRVCRSFLNLIDSTLRTTVYLETSTIAFKFDPTKISDMPAPRPMFEIFVCSPRVEGVHLRGGPIARGGLRWSDRREDFRTEVLGLVKAQMVKNAVIVPVGSKGGFVIKGPPTDMAELRAAGVACYKEFIGALLDLTDNVVDGQVVRPPNVVVYDGDDPYLVVAADKGTATFSDIANEVAVAHGFWLGDAFASGGSAGYDHKAMGITARGAWESVRRHARSLGRDADTDQLTAIGIGDMSGDVFGNGMLRSRALKLVAGFNHLHIFIDPTPDPELAFDERQRLFDLPRSSWSDYDPAKISEGGGVYSRMDKSIELSPQAQRALGTESAAVTPVELIRIILKAPVDLFWNGGIGTYVKSTSESHSDVGDRASDAVRVNGSELRCRMVGEGGNLGFTQLGRVEYALAGGLIYTDAIDNSAGVDCSDHEVNIKILLADVMQAGELTEIQRNALLEQMTDEVAELVLDNNQAQTLALLIAREQAMPMVNVHARYLDLLESEGWLDRSLEFIPTDKQIAERQLAGHALLTPEFAVMIAYTKNADLAEMMASDLPDDPALEEDVMSYFPKVLRERYPDAIRRHRLRREIGVTRLVNQMVNLSGISYDHRMTEETGAGVSDVARGWLAARDVFRFDEQWAEIDALGASVSGSQQLDLFLDCRRAAERCSLWLLRHRHPPLDVLATVQDFREPMAEVAAALPSLVTGDMGASLLSLTASRIVAGVPDALAERSVGWRLVHTAFDVIEIARPLNLKPADVAAVYWQVFDRLDVMWLWDGIGALPRSDRWQTQARAALRDDLLTVLADLTNTVLTSGGGTIEAWSHANVRAIGRVTTMFTEIRRAETYDLTNLSVALRQLRNLNLTSVRER